MNFEEKKKFVSPNKSIHSRLLIACTLLAKTATAKIIQLTVVVRISVVSIPCSSKIYFQSEAQAPFTLGGNAANNSRFRIRSHTKSRTCTRTVQVCIWTISMLAKHRCYKNIVHDLAARSSARFGRAGNTNQRERTATRFNRVSSQRTLLTSLTWGLFCCFRILCCIMYALYIYIYIGVWLSVCMTVLW